MTIFKIICSLFPCFLVALGWTENQYKGGGSEYYDYYGDLESEYYYNGDLDAYGSAYDYLGSYDHDEDKTVLVFKELKDGVEKLADVVTEISSNSFMAIVQTSIGERTAVRKIKKDIGEMHVHFTNSFNLMDGLRIQTENKYKKSKNEEALVQTWLRKVDREVITAASNLEGGKKQLADIQKDYDHAKSYYDRAKRDYNHEWSRHQAAQKEKDHWETVCLSTSWIPFVNIGTCLKYDAELGDLSTARQRRDARKKTLDNNRKWLQNAQNKKEQQEQNLRQLKSKQNQIKTKQQRLVKENWSLEAKNKLYAQSVHDFQLLNTEINVVFIRSKGAYEYTSFGTSIETLIMRLQGIEEHLNSNQDLLRMNPRILAAISASLAKMKKGMEKIKEKKITPDLLWI